MKYLSLLSILAVFFLTGLSGCSNSENANAEETGGGSVSEAVEETAAAPADEAAGELGVGPVTEAMDIPETIDPDMAAQGKAIFEAKCTACHKIEEKYIGPAMKGVTERRRPEWIMNMILAPEKMLQEDPVARQLAGETGAIMANQGLTEEEARQVLEYLRAIDHNQSI